MYLRVKICGITRIEDALMAAELGADALGFVFYEKSPRNIAFGDAAKIARELPEHVCKVGVFVDPGYEFAAQAVRTAGLNAIQLHGIGDAGRMVRVDNLPTILALPVKSAGIDPADATLVPHAEAVLLDTHHPTHHGGTGQTFDWSIAAAFAPKQRLILAGGLNSQNIRAAVETVRPFAVDVSSGVDASPGIKDAHKLSAFFKNIEVFRNDRNEENRGFFPISR